jgi:hypothetical protein
MLLPSCHPNSRMPNLKDSRRWPPIAVEVAPRRCRSCSPDIDAGKRLAESMRKQYGDPTKVEAMRKQALAAQAAMQAQRPSAGRSKQDVGDRQKELGLK